MFSRIDKAISQVNNVGIWISMSSSLIGKFESINSENIKGIYTGDGMTYVYLHVYDYESNYWKNINHYRLQGKTVTTAKRKDKTRFSGLETLTKYDFVGGAYSKLNMVAVMQFGIESVGFSPTLVGNKAYFVFWSELICLGNSINCEDDYEVEAIIENRNLTGKFYFGDKEIKEKLEKLILKIYISKIMEEFIYLKMTKLNII